MIYPNFLYYPDDDLQLFIDTVQQISYVTGCSQQEYTATDGSRQSVTSNMLPTATFECTWTENHLTDIFRYMDYLKGKRVILCFGPLDLASYAEIIDASIPVTVGTAQSVALQVKFLGGVRGQFREAEDSRNSNSTDTVSDSNACRGYAEKANAQYENVYYTFAQSDILLPVGDYTAFARLRDTTNIYRDIRMYVYNNTDSSHLASTQYHTLSGTGYQIITADFTVDSGDAGDIIKINIEKATADANNIYIDFFGFVKIP